MMTKNHRLAFNQLKKIGAPVYERSDLENFQISAEGLSSSQSYEGYKPDVLWADYYDGRIIPDWEFGINPRITQVLAEYGLHAEWINPGEIGVYFD
jgi:hypothetical protein